MSDYVLFVGCVIPMKYPSIEAAAINVFSKLGSRLETPPGFTCCPEPVMSRLIEEDFALAVSARNLAMAEATGKDLIAVCSGCYETLHAAAERLARDPEALDRVKGMIGPLGKGFKANVKVRYYLDVLFEDIGVPAIASKVTRKIGLRVASHPGCHAIGGEAGGTTRPDMLRAIVGTTGAELVDYGLERLCCGWPMMQVDQEAGINERLFVKLEAMKKAEVDAVLTTCPTCLMQFENGMAILKRSGHDLQFPVFHVLEILSMCMGADPTAMGLELHRTKVKEMAMAKLGGGVK